MTAVSIYTGERAVETAISYEELIDRTTAGGVWVWEGFDLYWRLRPDGAPRAILVGDCEIRPGQTCVIRGGKPTVDAAGQDPQPREVLERLIAAEAYAEPRHPATAETCRLARDLICSLAEQRQEYREKLERVTRALEP